MVARKKPVYADDKTNPIGFSTHISAKAFMAINRVPHPIPYQGSKRALAPAISRFVEGKARTLYEPFAGSAAFSLYAAAHKMADRFIIGDSLEPLVELWRLIVEQPTTAAAQYRKVWLGQQGEDATYFNKVREQFNDSHEPVLLLYLVARCVKNAVRFNRHGRFTQSADKRRLGMHPDKMAESIEGASSLLRGKVEFFCGDFGKCVSSAGPHDLVYMDPPYQGTTYGRDKRYFSQVETSALYDVLRELKAQETSIILSYDGMTGEKKHGEDLPEELGLKRFLLNAGRSSQATLNGESAITLESLYVWGDMTRSVVPVPRHEPECQIALPF
jgi:DNA adenine methylase